MDYIEREKIWSALNVACVPYNRATAKAIESIPAADVRPVLRGKWRFEEGDGETCSDGWVCSACSYGFHTHVPYFEDFNFCPNCGAYMKEEPRCKL